MKIAIIGAGMAGINVIRYYCENKKDTDFELLVFDREDYAGKGMPFIEDDEALLLNQRQNRMSLDGGFNGYIEWLEKNDPKGINREFTSRLQFGKYALDTFNHYIANEKVKYYSELVESIVKQEEKFIIKTKKDSYLVDGVHLCIGQLPQKDYYNLKEYNNFIPNPYPLIDKKEKLLQGKKIGIIGTGLSAVDIIVFLYKYNFNGKIKAISRNGVLPIVRGTNVKVLTPNTDREVINDKPQLKRILDALEQDAKNYKLSFEKYEILKEPTTSKTYKFQLEHLEELGTLQNIVSNNRYNYPDVWEKLSLEDRKKFMKEYKGLYLMWQSPMPKQSVEKLIELMDKNILKTYSGVEDIYYKEDTFVVKLKDKNTNADIMINATGASADLENLAYENDTYRLLKKLYEARLVDDEELGGIKIKYPTFSIITQKYGEMKNFKAHGEIVIGDHFVNNGISLISDKVDEAVDHMIETLEKNSN